MFRGFKIIDGYLFKNECLKIKTNTFNFKIQF